MRALVVLVGAVACSGSAQPPPAIGNRQPGIAPAGGGCPAHALRGTLHDLDDGEPLLGATIVRSAATAASGEDVTITDDVGSFAFTTASSRNLLTVYFADRSFAAELPTCAEEVTLGVHANADDGGEVAPLIIR